MCTKEKWCPSDLLKNLKYKRLNKLRNMFIQWLVFPKGLKWPAALSNWIKSHGPDSEEHKQSRGQTDRIKQLEKELKRVTMERDILKEATVFFASESKKNTRS